MFASRIITIRTEVKLPDRSSCSVDYTTHVVENHPLHLLMDLKATDLENNKILAASGHTVLPVVKRAIVFDTVISYDEYLDYKRRVKAHSAATHEFYRPKAINTEVTIVTKQEETTTWPWYKRLWEWLWEEA